MNHNAPVFALGLLAMLVATPARPGEPPSPPRYRLEVGQELVYESSSRFKFQGGSHGTKDKTTFWVARTNADGSWHILAHNQNTFIQSRGDADGGSPDREEKTFDSFDLHPDGRIANPPQGHRERELPRTFVRLPADAAAARAGWEQAKDDGDKSLFRLASQNDVASGKWVFDRTDQGVFNLVYLSTAKARIHFDAPRGLITKVEAEYTQGYGFEGKGTGIVELKSVRQKGPEWMAQLAQEADVLSKARTAARDVANAVKQGKDPKEATNAAEKLLRDGRNQVKLPMIRELFDEQIQELSRTTTYYAEEKRREDEVLNKAAADWSTTDIDGKKHSLAGYRGKVIVMDFWYRGCGWCVKAMPQIKELADHYSGKPVVVLGMNTDREEKDARFVVDKLKLNYATLKAEGLPKKYSVQGFPTLIVIDQKGIVRERHVGYSPTLREDLTRKIDGLLANEK